MTDISDIVIVPVTIYAPARTLYNVPATYDARDCGLMSVSVLGCDVSRDALWQLLHADSFNRIERLPRAQLDALIAEAAAAAINAAIGGKA
jgi:hypothetical protein